MKKITRILKICSLLIPTLLLAQPQQPIEIYKDECICSPDNASPDAHALAAVQAAGVLIDSIGPTRLIKLSPGVESTALPRQTLDRQAVLYGVYEDRCKSAQIPGYRCEPNQVVRLQETPGDEWWSYQWHLHQPENNIDIDAPTAWDLEKGDSTVYLAVFDTGLYRDHYDIRDANIAWEYAFNCFDNSKNVPDEYYHGTCVTSIIAASWRTGVNSGIAGIVPGVRIIPIKIFQGSGATTDQFSILKGHQYVIDLKKSGVNIVSSNHSYGYGGFSQIWFDKIKEFEQLGIAYVTAAGNYSTNTDNSPFYPGAYESNIVVNVGSIEANGTWSNYSNYGTRYTDMVAHGGPICATIGNPYYYYVWPKNGHQGGTSFSAPQVAAAIALAKSYKGDATWSQIRSCLLGSTKTIASTSGKSQAGLLDLDGILSCLNTTPMPTPTPVPTPFPTISPTPSVTPLPTATPTPVPTATTPPMSSLRFFLIDSATDQDLVEINSNSIIRGTGINIRTNNLEGSRCVWFVLDNYSIRREKARPYALCGDTAGNYAPCSPLSKGPHTVRAVAYRSDVGSCSNVISDKTIKFYVQ